MPTLTDLANAVRFLSIDMVERAGSGHPGAPLGMADFATVLWTQFLKFDPKNPKWPNRDRFVLSGGHASALLYSLLYLTGFEDITLDDLKNFRQLDAKTAGHPEYGMLAGIEATTGPLGQGLGMAIGMAVSEKMANARLGADLINHKIYVTCGDGDLMEGISEEAISMAGHLKLNNLIVLWDNNGITIDGGTEVATHTNQRARFEANGWQTFDINGHDTKAISDALTAAQTAEKPVFIACKTTIGFGAPTKAGTSASHGAPLGADEVAGVRKSLGWTAEPFKIPDDILTAWRDAGARGAAAYAAWDKIAAGSPQKAQMETMLSGHLSPQFDSEYAVYKNKLVAEKPVVATRKSSQMALEVLNTLQPNLVGGSADLTASNLTKVSSSEIITADNFSGNYIEYGVREHLMGAIMNGIALHGFFKPYGGTFFIFVDYLKPALRLSALMEQQAIYVLTHDSIGVGEDGPTHQPIEQLAMLRAVPGLCTIRPADALECAEAWEIGLKNTHTPTALILTRQNLPFLRTSADENLTAKGAYVISPAKDQRMVTLIGTGSEVSLAIDAQKQLWERGVDSAVVSMPSWDLFDAQTADYKAEVLGSVPRVAVEAASPFGWERYAHLVVGMKSFGASGPAKKVYEKAGLTIQNVVETVLEALSN